MRRPAIVFALMFCFVATNVQGAQKMSTSQSAVIGADRVEVWDLLVRVELWEEWNPAVKDADIKKGDGYSVGTIIDFKPIIDDKEADKVELELDVSKRLEKLEYRGEKAGMDIVFGFELEKLEDGRTKVTSYETITGPGTTLFKLLYGQKGLDKEHRVWVETMKKKLETDIEG